MDVGTGNGPAASMLDGHYEAVVPADISELQLSLAAQDPNATYIK